jgi:hypothetical protein
MAGGVGAVLVPAVAAVRPNRDGDSQRDPGTHADAVIVVHEVTGHVTAVTVPRDTDTTFGWPHSHWRGLSSRCGDRLVDA